jgi:hypothetical protein
VPEGEKEARAHLVGGDLPDLPANESLQEAWAMMGRCGHTMNGAAPFDWSEIEAFGRVARPLSRIEATTLRDMSEAFAAELRERSPLRIAPMDRYQRG